MIKLWYKLIILNLSICVTTLAAAEIGLSQSLSSNVSVTGSMTAGKFQQLMQQGFRSVIVNRPDYEAGNQTTVSELRSLAEKSNMSLIYQPVSSAQITNADVQEFAKYYNSLPKPILLVCKSGNRSTVLYNRAKSLGLLYE